MENSKNSINHVLIIPSWFPLSEKDINGRFFLEQAKILRNSGKTVGVLYPVEISIKDIFRFSKIKYKSNYSWLSGINVVYSIHLKWNFFFRYLELSSYVSRGLNLYRDYVEKFGVPDVIHVQGVLNAGCLAANIKRKYKIPFVATEHSSALGRNLYSRYQKEKYREILIDANLVSAVSTGLRDDIRKKFQDLQIEIEILGNPVHTDFFNANTVRHPPSNGIWRCVTVGSLNKNKNQKLILNSLYILKNKFSINTHLTIVGAGSEYKNLILLVNKLNLLDCVSFVEKFERNELIDIFNSTHIYLHSSIYETYSLIIAEAICAGLPVVTTDCGGPRDFVNEVNGILVREFSVDDYVRGVKEVIRQYDAGFNSFESKKMNLNFSEASYVNKVNKLFIDANREYNGI